MVVMSNRAGLATVVAALLIVLFIGAMCYVVAFTRGYEAGLRARTVSPSTSVV